MAQPAAMAKRTGWAKGRTSGRTESSKELLKAKTARSRKEKRNEVTWNLESRIARCILLFLKTRAYVL